MNFFDFGFSLYPRFYLSEFQLNVKSLTICDIIFLYKFKSKNVVYSEIFVCILQYKSITLFAEDRIN